MKVQKAVISILCAAIFSYSIILFSGCSNQGLGTDIGGTISYSDETSDNTYGGTGDEIFHVDTSGYVNLTYTLHLGAAIRDVYFIFTNTSTSNGASNPTVTNISGDFNITYDTSKTKISKNAITSAKPIGLRGKPEIDRFNENPFKYVESPSGVKGGDKSIMVPPTEPLFDIIDETNVFMYDSTTANLIPATCKKVVTGVNGKILNIWVADDCWTGAGGKAKEITQPMVDEMADRFLISGDDNDIYEWVAAIFGDEWGAHSYLNLISDNDEITILLYDIDNDNSTSGGVLAFFWSKDNFKASGIDCIPYSNERIMLYVDAVLYATDEGGSWDSGDNWPSEIISTLGHEFQHAIHFYQKAVLRTGGSNSETWINELCSLATEDFIADKIGLGTGPRGVASSDGTAGGQNNENGRLPLYNVWNDVSLIEWLSGGDVLKSYSITYAFGAYLARDFGGVTLFKNIVQNDKTAYTSIEYGLTKGAYTEDFGEVLQKWGAANLVSDNISPPGGNYQYNSEGFFTSSGYNAGSINLFNYIYGPQSGPWIYNSSPVGEGVFPSLLKASNRYYEVGIDLTGDVTRTVKLDNNVKLTVVVKE